MENKPQGMCAFGLEKSSVFTVPYFSIRPSRSKTPTPAPSVHLKAKMAAINGETRGTSTISRKNRGLYEVYKKRNFGSFCNRISLACVQTSPLPQKKSGEKKSRFFLREGRRLYTGYISPLPYIAKFVSVESILRN